MKNHSSQRLRMHGTSWLLIQLGFIQRNAWIHISIIYSTHDHHHYAIKVRKLRMTLMNSNSTQKLGLNSTSNSIAENQHVGRVDELNPRLWIALHTWNMEITVKTRRTMFECLNPSLFSFSLCSQKILSVNEEKGSWGTNKGLKVTLKWQGFN